MIMMIKEPHFGAIYLVQQALRHYCSMAGIQAVLLASPIRVLSKRRSWPYPALVCSGYPGGEGDDWVRKRGYRT